MCFSCFCFFSSQAEAAEAADADFVDGGLDDGGSDDGGAKEAFEHGGRSEEGGLDQEGGLDERAAGKDEFYKVQSDSDDPGGTPGGESHERGGGSQGATDRHELLSIPIF